MLRAMRCWWQVTSGPSGEILFPLGTTQPEEAKAAFAEQAAALAEGGVDFFLIETMSALEEMQAAIDGIRSVSDLPDRGDHDVRHSLPHDDGHQACTGGQGASRLRACVVMGANCGNGPAEIERIVSEMMACEA